jgi:hypothetical protein
MVVNLMTDNKLVCGLVVTAAISTMPAAGAPLSWRTLYGWIYDGAHLFLNLRRPTLPAETPANPKP